MSGSDFLLQRIRAQPCCPANGPRTIPFSSFVQLVDEARQAHANHTKKNRDGGLKMAGTWQATHPCLWELLKKGLSRTGAATGIREGGGGRQSQLCSWLPVNLQSTVETEQMLS